MTRLWSSQSQISSVAFPWWWRLNLITKTSKNKSVVMSNPLPCCHPSAKAPGWCVWAQQRLMAREPAWCDARESVKMDQADAFDPTAAGEVPHGVVLSSFSLCFHQCLNTTVRVPLQGGHMLKTFAFFLCRNSTKIIVLKSVLLVSTLLLLSGLVCSTQSFMLILLVLVEPDSSLMQSKSDYFVLWKTNLTFQMCV